MVTHKRLRTALNALTLYAIATLVIGYFWANAYSGNNGLLARQDIDVQVADLSAELRSLKGERAAWTRRVALLKSDRIDPDLLDERARAMLDYVGQKDLVLLLKPR